MATLIRLLTIRIFAKSLSGLFNKLIESVNLLFFFFAYFLISVWDREKNATSDPEIIAEKTSKSKSRLPCRNRSKKSRFKN